jgi:hypothetical protein
LDHCGDCWISIWKKSKASIGIILGKPNFVKYRKAFPESVSLRISATPIYGQRTHAFVELSWANPSVPEVLRVVFAVYHPGE